MQNVDVNCGQVRAANSLLSITHSMKLLLLLSDESQISHRRDAELKAVREEKNEARKQVAALLDELLVDHKGDVPPTNTPSSSVP